MTSAPNRSTPASFDRNIDRPSPSSTSYQTRVSNISIFPPPTSRADHTVMSDMRQHLNIQRQQEAQRLQLREQWHRMDQQRIELSRQMNQQASNHLEARLACLQESRSNILQSSSRPSQHNSNLPETEAALYSGSLISLQDISVWRDKAKSIDDLLILLQAFAVGIHSGDIDKDAEVTKRELETLFLSVRNNIHTNGDAESKNSLGALSEIARRCKNAHLISEYGFEVLRAINLNSQHLAHLENRLAVTNERLNQHIFSTHSLATDLNKYLQSLARELSNQSNNIMLLNNQQRQVANNMIDIGSKMRRMRFSSAMVNIGGAILEQIPVLGPLVVNASRAGIDFSCYKSAASLLTGLQTLKEQIDAGIISPIGSEMPPITFGTIIPALQDTEFGQIELSDALNDINDAFVRSQLRSIEETLLNTPDTGFEVSRAHAQLGYSSSRKLNQTENESGYDSDIPVSARKTFSPVGFIRWNTEEMNNTFINLFNNSTPKEKKRLIQAKIPTNSQHVESSLLDYAAHHGNATIARFLLEQGADTARNDRSCDDVYSIAITKHNESK